LLIHELDPCGNTGSTKTRPRFRSGMKVYCTGAWPLKRDAFFDPGEASRKKDRNRVRASSAAEIAGGGLLRDLPATLSRWLSGGN
jgi:hypothetical protein